MPNLAQIVAPLKTNLQKDQRMHSETPIKYMSLDLQALKKLLIPRLLFLSLSKSQHMLENDVCGRQSGCSFSSRTASRSRQVSWLLGKVTDPSRTRLGPYTRGLYSCGLLPHHHWGHTWRAPNSWSDRTTTCRLDTETSRFVKKAGTKLTAPPQIWILCDAPSEP